MVVLLCADRIGVARDAGHFDSSILRQALGRQVVEQSFALAGELVGIEGEVDLGLLAVC